MAVGSMTISQAKRLWRNLTGRKRFEEGACTVEGLDGTICAYDANMRLLARREPNGNVTRL